MNVLLSSEGFGKVLRGAALAAVGAAAAYVAQRFGGTDATYGPVIAGVAAVVANYIRKLIEENSATPQ